MDKEARMLLNGITQLELKEFAKAHDSFLQVTNHFPEEWRAWMGCALASSKLNYNVAQTEKSHVFTLLNKAEGCSPDLKKRIGKLDIYSEEHIADITNRINQEDVIIDCKMEELQEADMKDARATLLCWTLSGAAVISFFLFFIGLAIGSPIAGLGIITFFACIVPIVKKFVLERELFPDLEDMRARLTQHMQDRTRLIEERERIKKSPDIDYYINILKGQY